MYAGGKIKKNRVTIGYQKVYFTFLTKIFRYFNRLQGVFLIGIGKVL